MENLEIYEKVRAVPAEAKRDITAGRLKGKTDINPMWRIKKLTELFGACGFGWYTEIKRTWLDVCEKEVVCNVEISLFIKSDEGWSKPIPGIGGSKIIESESKGLYTDDEAYKKAYTDAISVACKALGIGADVYWDKDPTKYTNPNTPPQPQRPTAEEVERKSILAKIAVGMKQKAITGQSIDNILLMTVGKTNSKDMTVEELKKVLDAVERVGA